MLYTSIKVKDREDYADSFKVQDTRVDHAFFRNNYNRGISDAVDGNHQRHPISAYSNFQDTVGCIPQYDTIPAPLSLPEVTTNRPIGGVSTEVIWDLLNRLEGNYQEQKVEISYLKGRILKLEAFLSRSFASDLDPSNPQFQAEYNQAFIPMETVDLSFPPYDAYGENDWHGNPGLHPRTSTHMVNQYREFIHSIVVSVLLTPAQILRERTLIPLDKVSDCSRSIPDITTVSYFFHEL